MTLELGNSFQKFKDPQGNPLISINRDGSVNCLSLNFSDGTSQTFSSTNGHGVYNVLAFGAQCDGITDDSTAVQAAINAAGGGGVVLFPTGTCVVGATIILPSGVTLAGTGRASTIIQGSGSLPASVNVVETANYQILKGTSSTTNQPANYGLYNLTIDGNVAQRGIYSASSLEGHCFASHGAQFIVRQVDFINAPQDGAYSEGPGSGIGTGVGNLSVWDFARAHHCTNNGMTISGPPDSQFNQPICYFNGNYGAAFLQVPSVGSGNYYVNNLHNFHNGSWGAVIESYVMGTNFQTEHNGQTTTSGGISISSGGALSAGGVFVWYNNGVGLQLDSPQTSTFGRVTIDNIQALDNTSWGLVATANCMSATLNCVSIYRNGAGVQWSGSDSLLEGLVIEDNTGVGLDISQTSLSAMSISGNIGGNGGTSQVLVPSSASNSYLRLIISPSSSALSGALPSGITAEISLVGGADIQMASLFTPASSAASGQTGQIAWDANYLYVYTGSAWKRAPLSTF